MLERVAFGATSMHVSRVGLGLRGVTDEDFAPTLDRAVSHGVNWIDTVGVGGHAVGGRWSIPTEERIGAWCNSLPAGADRPYVFTKCGAPPGMGAALGIERPGDAASLRAQCEGSLRRLGVEQLDMLQMWWPPDDGTPLDDYYGTLLELKAEGKIRAVGLSNHSLEQVQAANALGHVDGVQPPFSAITRDAASELIPWCADNRTAVIGWGPMAHGLLTGAFSSERVATLPADDPRRHWPVFGDELQSNLALAESLRPIADRHDCTQAAVAIAWALAWPGLTGAIVGARNPEQIDGWVAGGTIELSPEDLQEIADAITRLGVGSGPVSPSVIDGSPS